MNDCDNIYWVYILENAAGTLYVGSTNDVVRRLTEHNDSTKGHTTYNHKNGPWRLIWSEPHPTRALAMARERHIKRMKSFRVIRGGGWNFNATNCRSSYRLLLQPFYRYDNNYGFRVVCASVVSVVSSSSRTRARCLVSMADARPVANRNGCVGVSDRKQSGGGDDIITVMANVH